MKHQDMGWSFVPGAGSSVSGDSHTRVVYSEWGEKQTDKKKKGLVYKRDHSEGLDLSELTLYELK